MAGYSGDAGDALAAPLYPNYVANGRNFSSPGSDNDDWPTSSCAGHYGGWWYDSAERAPSPATLTPFGRPAPW